MAVKVMELIIPMEKIKKGIKFLHMKEAPCPMSPKSPKLWKYMMGRENDDYDYYYQEYFKLLLQILLL